MKGFCSTDKHRVINYVKLSWRDCSIIQSDILTFDATSNNTVLEMQPKPQNHSHLKWLWTGLEDESSYMCFLKKKKKEEEEKLQSQWKQVHHNITPGLISSDHSMLLDNALMEVVGNICAFAVTNQSTSIGRTKGCLKLNVSFGHLSLSCICSGPSVYLSIIIISYTNTEVIVMKILFF